MPIEYGMFTSDTSLLQLNGDRSKRIQYPRYLNGLATEVVFATIVEIVTPR